MHTQTGLWPCFAIAFALIASACNRNVETRSEPAPRAAAAPAPSAPLRDAAPRIDFAKFGLDELTPAAKDQLTQVASDEFCYCGCPHLLAGCLAEHPDCQHAPRMLRLGAALAQMGARSSEIIGGMQRYYGSFKQDKRAQIDLTGVACQGPAAAPVTIVEYSDFECPHCAAARPMLEGFVKISDKVRLCFKHFPLPGHANALKAAQATEFAKAHGKFWEMHDLVFEHQSAMSMEDLKKHAAKLGLDPAAMETAVLADTYLPQVEAMRNEGRRIGIDGTPAVFINGRPFTLPLSPGALVHAVEDELEYMQAGRWAQD